MYAAGVRVLLLVANPITYDGRVVRHAQTLAQAGHDVAVLGVLGPGDRAEAPPQLGFSWQRIDRRKRGVMPRLRWFGSALRQRAARLVRGAMSDEELGGILGALSVATSAPELFIETLRQSPDVIHANDLNTLPAAAWAAARLGRPYVYDAHELYPDEHPDLDENERRTRAAVEGHYLRDAAAVLTVNELLADELQRRYEMSRRPVVLRNLPRRVVVPDPSQRPVGEARTLRLLYHGAHVGLAQQGVDDMLRALSRLRDWPDISLTMRGALRPLEASELQQRIDALGITDRVRLSPPVPGAEALVEAAISDGAEVGLAVHPPLCGSYVLTTSSKLYEYQAAGLAVCATDVLGNRHTVGKGAGIFYRAGDDARLADELAALSIDRTRLRAMQSAAYAHAQAELAWERESTRLLAVYAALANPQTG